MPIFPAFQGLRQEDYHKFKTSLEYLTSLCHKITKSKKKIIIENSSVFPSPSEAQRSVEKVLHCFILMEKAEVWLQSTSELHMSTLTGRLCL